MSVFKKGDYNVICDTCGFEKKRSECRYTWNNFLVCASPCWEPRHPQDFVKGKADKQSVPDARPDTQVLHNSTTVKTAVSKGSLTIDLDSVGSLADGDSIGVTTDDDSVHWTFLAADPSGDTVTIFEALPGDAAVGNTVYVPGDDFVETNEVTVGDL